MTNQSTIYIGSDHAGFERKEALKQFLLNHDYSIEDLGPAKFDQDDDYPDFALAVAQKVQESGDRGIVICGNGQGVCITANKVRGIRAASAFSPEVAKTIRIDDDANILCLPGRFLEESEIEAIVIAWLTTDFSDAERHKRRIAKISNYENQHLS